jgi:hypothetical protein
MNIDQAAAFLAATILSGLGFICVAIIILVINNLFSKYWKPVTFFKYIFASTLGANPPRFVDTTEPTLNKDTK